MKAASPLNTGAVTSRIGEQWVGLVLGVPFFALGLIGILTGHLPDRGHSPASDALANIAELYVLLLVLPCSAVLSAALSAFVAPPGQERRFAAGAFFYYAQMLLIMLVLTGSLFAYAGTGPLWARTLGHFHFPSVLGALAVSLLFSAMGSALGYVWGINSRLHEGIGTPLLQKLSQQCPKGSAL